MTEKYYLLGLTPPLTVTAALQHYQEKVFSLTGNVSALCFSPLIPLCFFETPLSPPKRDFRLTGPLKLMQPFVLNTSLFLELQGAALIDTLKAEIISCYGQNGYNPSKEFLPLNSSLFIAPDFLLPVNPAIENSAAATALPTFSPEDNIKSFSSLTLCFFEYRIFRGKDHGEIQEFGETLHWEARIRKPKAC